MKNSDKLNIISKITGILLPIMYLISFIYWISYTDCNAIMYGHEVRAWNGNNYIRECTPTPQNIVILGKIINLVVITLFIINILIIVYSIIMIIKNTIEEKNKTKRKDKNSKFINYILNIIKPILITIAILGIIYLISPML